MSNMHNSLSHITIKVEAPSALSSFDPWLNHRKEYCNGLFTERLGKQLRLTHVLTHMHEHLSKGERWSEFTAFPTDAEIDDALSRITG